MSERPAEIPDYLTMAEAAKLTPGRPEANTVWRWARRGLKVRGRNEKLWLQHVRVGGRIFTTEDWLYEFFHQVAKEDMASCEIGADAAAACASHADADLELRAEGL